MLTPEDLDAALAVRFQVFVVEQDVPLDIERDEHDRDADHVLALRPDGSVVGTGRVVVEGDHGRVGRVAVLAEVRGTGVGRLLMDALEEAARRRELPAVELHSQAHATGFYAALGYAPVGEPFDEAGIEHITMRKALT